MIYQLDQLPKTAESVVGGKARVLAQLLQQGFPVPAGFVIGPEAFEEGGLQGAFWREVVGAVRALSGDKGLLGDGRFPAVAVRSSAVSEDSAGASFAGEFESILNVDSEGGLRTAIQAVYDSQFSERVVAYSEAQGLGREHRMAVIVQKMVAADWAGVLFTADPVTGSHRFMSGNFVGGLGERLVSGEADGEVFRLERPSGGYDGPEALKPFARQLFRLGERLADRLGGPQDIEWAVAGKRVFILQARPITTMQSYNLATGETNDSFRGDYLWSNANFGEAIPGVMTPLTWSLVRIFGEETFGNPLPGDNPLMGNIGGRFYINLSLIASSMGALGMSRERINVESEEFFGNLPENVDIPMIPFSRWAVLKGFLPFGVGAFLRRRRNMKGLAAFTAEMPARTAEIIGAIQGTDSAEALADYWRDTFEPLLRLAYQMMQAGTSEYENVYRALRRELAEMVGEGEANLLLSGVSVDGERLASLGPVVGLWQVSQGELSGEDYLQQFGHRGEHEFEVSWPRPAEDPNWLDSQLETIGAVDVPGLLAGRERAKGAAWERFCGRFPNEVDEMGQKLAKAAAAARGREAIRSEVTRLLGAGRYFALKAGELSGLGEGAYFLSLAELLAVLRDGEAANSLAQIPVRRAAYERLSALPPYPALIRGRFDPHRWAADPERRSDIFDADGDGVGLDTADDVIRGLPGSAGVVEGVVRKLESIEAGHLLEAGEILVAVTTNVGWTPLFPRAAAVVTDVGAPLSHAAIVARELGIPAVVGTGVATMRLETGDRVRVNGTVGVVEVIGGKGHRAVKDTAGNWR